MCLVRLEVELGEAVLSHLRGAMRRETTHSGRCHGPTFGRGDNGLVRLADALGRDIVEGTPQHLCWTEARNHISTFQRLEGDAPHDVDLRGVGACGSGHAAGSTSLRSRMRSSRSSRAAGHLIECLCPILGVIFRIARQHVLIVELERDGP